MGLGNVNGIDINAILEPALLLGDLNIISTHLPLAHDSILPERPVFESITALPLHAIMGILIFVPELDSDLVLSESEELLAQLVVLLLVPFPGQEFNDGFSAGEKFVPVTPDAIARVAFRHLFGISRLQSDNRSIG
jgi:hypothetical protein